MQSVHVDVHLLIARTFSECDEVDRRLTVADDGTGRQVAKAVSAICRLLAEKAVAIGSSFEAKAQNERFGEIIAAVATRAALDEGELASGELRGALEAAARAAAGARDSGSFESNAQCARFGEIVAAVATRAALDEGALASGELRGALAAAACASAKAFHIAHYASGAKKAADSAALIHATADGKSFGASDV